MSVVVARAETPTMRPDIETAWRARTLPRQSVGFCSMFCLPNIEARCAGKRLNNGFIVEDQTIVVPAVLSETDLGMTETVNG